MNQTHNKEKVITYFLYRRKSTDEKDRQILSLESQETEALRRFSHLKIIKLPPESVSAFKPEKRPIFNSMIERIKKGEAQGIIAWHPDRLSRNPIDAAQIIFLVDIGALKDLKFCSYNFDNSPEGKMMLNMTMSQSKYSSDKLSADVKRGLELKVLAGWRPNQAPLGYLNSKTNLKGKQVIYKDPLRFDMVKQIWNMMLTDNHSAPEVLRIATNEWKLRHPGTISRPERKIYLSGFCRMLTNPFYYGYFEYPKGSGNLVKGNHPPMITEQEFDRVQFVLGRKGRPRPKTHKFAFTGLMKCVCGAGITAEEKFKHQKNGNVHHYIYYRCTRRVDENCTEKAIEIKNFTKQVDDIISKLTISEEFKNWAIKNLHEIRKDEARASEQIVISQHKRYETIQKQIDNLLLKYSSPDNSDNQLITNEEYAKMRSTLLKEKNELEALLNATGQKIEEWLELSEKTFNFACYARDWFAKGDLNTKRAIFACLGSDLILKGKKVSIQLKKPFDIIFEGLPKAYEELIRFEPLQIELNRANFIDSISKSPILSG